MSIWYRQGTVSIANGATTVNGTLTGFTNQTKVGDRITFDAGGKWYEIASVTDNTHLELATQFAETTISGGAYAIDRSSVNWTDAGDMAIKIALVLAQQTDVLSGTGAPAPGLGSQGSIYIDTAAGRLYIKGAGGWDSGTPLIGHGAGLEWLFDSATDTTVNPGNGDLRANHGTAASITELAVSDVTAETGAPSAAAWTAIWGTGTSVIKGYLYIFKSAAPQVFALLEVTAVNPQTGFKRFTVVHRGGPGGWSNTDRLGVVFVPKGDKGESYAATSATSLAIATGNKAFTTQAGLAYVAGSRARAASAGDPTGKWMEGPVASYVGTTLTLTVDLISPIGGTFNDWNLSLAGERGLQGLTGLTGGTGAAAPFSLDYEFDTSTVGDPGSGKIAVNHATPASITGFQISETDRLGSGKAALVATAGISTNVTKARVDIIDVNANSNWISLLVTSAVTDNGGWDSFLASYLAHGGTIADDARVSVIITPYGNAGASSGIFGQCRLTKSGSDLLLSPRNGALLTINGVAEVVPDAGVSLSPSGLSSNTSYYIYVYMNAGAMTMEASTTAPAVSTAAGNKGVNIKAGDNMRTLVGMARTNGSTAWVDSATQRFVLSYFNRRARSLVNWFTANRATSATSFGEINSEIRCEFLAWADEAITAAISGAANNSAAGNNVHTSIGIDGGAAEETVSSGTNGNNEFFPVPCTLHKEGLAEGMHYVTLVGRVGAGTGTWLGSGTQGARTTLSARIMG